MGKDIHAVLEVMEEGRWEPVPDIPDLLTQRSYDIFEMLERTGTPGIPEELENKRFRRFPDGSYDVDFSKEDPAGFGYASTTLKEIKEYIARYEDGYYISEKLYSYLLDNEPELSDFLLLQRRKKAGHRIHYSVLTCEDDEKNAIQKDLMLEIESTARKYRKKDEEIRAAYYFEW